MYQRTEQEIMKNWKDNLDLPVVSVCCTTFNHEPYIAEAIDGFLMQETEFPFEILIRDDCSTDKTASIVKEYAEKYPSLIKPVFEKENTYSKGVKPMPQLFKLATGKYIALCEGDDYWTDPLKLQKQVDFLEESEDYVITYTSAEGFDENGKVDNYKGGSTRDLESIELQKCAPINTLTVCFRNILMELPPEFQCTRFGDLFLWSLLGEHGRGKYLKNIKPSKYRIHSGGIFSMKTAKQKLKMAYITSFALYAYYSRIDNKLMSNYFHKKHVIYSLELYGYTFYIKHILQHFIERIIFKKKKIINRLFK